MRALAGDRVLQLVGALTFALEGRVPLADVFSAASRGRSSRFGRVCDDAASRLVAGARLSEALAASGDFPGELVALVRVGERSGTLDVVLSTYLGELERREERRDLMAATLAYPTILLVSLGCVAALLVALAPLSPISVTSKARSTVALSAGLALPALLLVLRFAPPGATIFRLPFAGPALLEERRALVFRSLGFLLSRGVTLPEALRLAAPLARSMGDELLRLASDIEAGRRFDGTLDSGRLFGAAARAAVSSPRRPLPRVLDSLAESSEGAAERLARDAAASLDIALTIGAGITVGLFVVSAYDAYFEAVGKGFLF